MLGQEPASELDVLDDENAWTYWSRSDAFTMTLDIGSNPRSREGLARVIEVWLRHCLGVEARSSRWPGSRTGTGAGSSASTPRHAHRQCALEGRDHRRGRRLAGDRCGLAFAPGTPVEARAAGRPVYLLLAMTPDRVVRMKPQNLIVGLPLAGPGAGGLTMARIISTVGVVARAQAQGAVGGPRLASRRRAAGRARPAGRDEAWRIRRRDEPSTPGRRRCPSTLMRPATTRTISRPCSPRSGWCSGPSATRSRSPPVTADPYEARPWRRASATSWRRCRCRRTCRRGS